MGVKSRVWSPSSDCRVCGAKRPTSHVAVGLGDSYVGGGAVCASHTLHEVIFAHRGSGKRIMVTLELMDDT